MSLLKAQIQAGGFFDNLHCLLFMDETVLLATNRHMCEKKIQILLKFCQVYFMQVNDKKTKFMVIYGTDDDKCPIAINEHKIEHCY